MADQLEGRWNSGRAWKRSEEQWQSNEKDGGTEARLTEYWRTVRSRAYREKEGGTVAEPGRGWRESSKGMSWNKQCKESMKDRRKRVSALRRNVERRHDPEQIG